VYKRQIFVAAMIVSNFLFAGLMFWFIFIFTNPSVLSLTGFAVSAALAVWLAIAAYLRIRRTIGGHFNNTLAVITLISLPLIWAFPFVAGTSSFGGYVLIMPSFLALSAVYLDRDGALT